MTGGVYIQVAADPPMYVSVARVVVLLQPLAEITHLKIFPRFPSATYIRVPSDVIEIPHGYAPDGMAIVVTESFAVLIREMLAELQLGT